MGRGFGTLASCLWLVSGGLLTPAALGAQRPADTQLPADTQGSAHAQLPADARFPSDAEVREILDARVRAGSGTGIVVGLLDADGSTRVVFAGSAGEGARPLGPETVFEIGSITKVFTGTLLADMARRGEVALDDPVAHHLPPTVSMPVRGGREITLLDLVTHRSGLPRSSSNRDPSYLTDPEVDYTPRQLYDFLSSYELTRDIGSSFAYSNLGVGLLGHVLGLAAGLDYEVLVSQRILEPLGMTLTGIEIDDALAPRLAQGHDERGAVIPPWHFRTMAGAGALRSNAVDMLRFLDANVGEPTSELEQAMREAQAPHRPLAGDESEPPVASEPSIGLAWLTSKMENATVVWHGGGTAGFTSFVGFDPQRQRGVVVLSNTGGEVVDDIGMHLLDASAPLRRTSGAPGWAVVALLLLAGVGVLGLEFLGSAKRARGRAPRPHGRRATGSAP